MAKQQNLPLSRWSTVNILDLWHCAISKQIKQSNKKRSSFAIWLFISLCYSSEISNAWSLNMAHPHAPPRCIRYSTPRLAQAKLLLIALNMWHRGLRDFLFQLKYKIRLTARRGKDTFRTERKSKGGRSRWMERHER